MRHISLRVALAMLAGIAFAFRPALAQTALAAPQFRLTDTAGDVRGGGAAAGARVARGISKLP